MLNENKIYVKSLESIEETLATTYKKGETKSICQTADEIIQSRRLFPNSTSFGLQQRLCIFELTFSQSGTYRPEGLIFKTQETPEISSPIDLIALTYQDPSKDYLDNNLIPGWNEFLKTTPKSLPQFYNKLNQFRKNAGANPLNKSQLKELRHNEQCYFYPIKIDIIGVYGDTEIAKDIAKKNNLPHYQFAKDAIN